jgi:hypothetical protein
MACGSLNAYDTVAALENLAACVPQELRQDAALRRRLFDAVLRLVPELESPVELSQRLLYTVSIVAQLPAPVQYACCRCLCLSDRELCSRAR